MCGIVGFIGKSGSLQVLVDSLKRLEYRGYDSAGIAFQNGHGLEVYKTKGRIKDLQRILPEPSPEVTIGLGHTRWATHGAPSSTNAHPHVCSGVAVVHNGIIENYRELRSDLERKGHQFLSETDTEVVPQLIAGYVQQGYGIKEAIQAAAAQLRGTFALGIMSELSPGTLFAVRKGSPLVIGFGDEICYFASDIPAILPYTRRFVFMEDGQICTFTANTVDLAELGSEAVVSFQDKVVEIDWSPAMAEKAGHDHFMHKEIYEQPQAITRTLGERLGDPLGVTADLGPWLQNKEAISNLHIVSCGSSSTPV